jgi:hypothetical protein
MCVSDGSYVGQERSPYIRIIQFRSAALVGRRARLSGQILDDGAPQLWRLQELCLSAGQRLDRLVRWWPSDQWRCEERADERGEDRGRRGGRDSLTRSCTCSLQMSAKLVPFRHPHILDAARDSLR